MDTIGNNVKLTLFGASHAEAVGFELCGIPEGVTIDTELIERDLWRRSAAAHEYATPRHEADEMRIEAGIENGVTTGGVIRVSFANRAYDRYEYRPVARPSHADLAAFVRSEGREDISGGGRYSGRMTLPLTCAGAICRQLLSARGIVIFSHVLKIGELCDRPFDPMMEKKPDMDELFPLVDGSLKDGMMKLIADTREAGDTLSCAAECAVLGLPVGLGEPLFDGLEGTLSRYLFMIPGLRAVEFCEDIPLGSLTNDQFTEGGRTLTNRSFGINGGMANGSPLLFRARFRPVPSISLPQTGFDLASGKPVPLTITGRHDTCILPRGLAAVEAAAALALLDLLMEFDVSLAEGLEELRRELDSTDAELMRLFDRRMRISERIGEIKRVSMKSIEDRAREEKVMASRISALPEPCRSGGGRLLRLLIDESKRTQRRGMNLYLIGMPDCGKTRMGRRLKASLKLPLADTDRLIAERTGLTIDGIFARFGEAAFRGMETNVLRAIVKRGGLIVATGGGLPLSEENAKLMKSSGVTVFLDRSLERLHGQDTKDRPLLAAKTQEEVDANIDRLYHERHERYSSLADLTLDPDADGAAERIEAFFTRFIETGGSN